MRSSRPFVLSVAGFDPSAGAGLLADIKTFEAMGVYGMGVCSALTVQNDETFDRVEWVAPELILAQIKNLMTRFSFSHVKVGLIQNLAILSEVVNSLADVKIIWDPILQSSTGYRFRESGSQDSGVEKLLSKLYLMTPNIPEMAELGSGDPVDAAKRFGEYCSVLLKGGHAEGETVTDLLFPHRGATEARGPASSRESSSGQAGPQIVSFTAPRIPGAAKHGSGCVLSAAITARLALGDSLPEACRKAGEYTRAFLASAPGLLGYHSRTPEEQHA